MKKENKMGVMPIPRLVITMALPLMLSLLVQSLYNIVDGIFVGMLSEEAFTATSLAYPIQLLMVAVSVGTGVGVNALCSRLVGAKQFQEAGIAATTGLVLSLISTAVFMIIGIFFVPLYLNLCSGSEAAIAMCGRYLRICTLFCLGVFIETLAQRLLQAVGKTVLSMVSLVGGALVNIILDPIFIFGLNMGIEGAAIATVIGQWVGALIALLLNAKYNQEISFVFHGFHLQGSMVRRIYQVGFPSILTQAFGSAMMFSINAILGLLYAQSSAGADPTAAIAFFGAYYKLQNFLYMPIMGLGQATIPIVGYNLGAKNPDRIHAVVKTALPSAIGYALLGTVVFEVFPRQLLGIFSASASALSIGIPALRIIALTFAAGAATTVLGYVCSGLGNGMINMIGTCLHQFIPLVPLMYLFGRLFGVGSIWYAMWICEGLAVLYTALSTRKELTKAITPIPSRTLTAA